MSKEEIVNQLKEECSNASIELTKTDLSKIYDMFMKIIKSGLIENKKMRLREICTLSTFTRKPRKCRNPRTGESMTVPEKTGVKFNASSTLLNILNEKK